VSPARLRFRVLFAALLATTSVAQETRPFALAPKQFPPLDTSAQLMARSGWGEVAEELIANMKTLGYSEAQAEKLVKLCKTESKGKKRTPVPAVIKSLKSSAQQIAKEVATAAPESDAVARAVLAIDGSIESMHVLLGEEKTATGWLSPAAAKAASRRGEIVTALAKTRRIPVEITTAQEDHALIQELHGKPCTKVTAHGLSLSSRWPAEKLGRVLREILRGTALSHYLLRGTLEIPSISESFIILDSRTDYDRAIDAAKKNGWLSDKEADLSRRLSAFDLEGSGRYRVCFIQTEAYAQAAIHYSCSGYTGLHEFCPPLRVGHVNWLCLAYFGTELPGISWTEVIGEKPQRRTASGADPVDERKQMLRLSTAGVAGSRSWLAYLAAHGEDPPFSNAIVDQDGKIEGNDRLKCTFVADFLQEHDELVGLAKKTAAGTRASFEEAWGGTFASFESRFRRWLLGVGPSIVEQLDPPKPRALTPGEADVLTRLNEHRRRCFKGSICGDIEPSGAGDWPIDLITPYLEVTLDQGLSDGTRKHAAYLGKHPEQLAAWPDAHEEWPDRPEFTTEGSWSGLHSVIAPGVKNADEALTGWLGTFYHRLPLIDPGLLRVGWGLQNEVAVLDSGSLVRPMPGPWHVIWPYDGMTDVPTRFAPELPNPVPGVDQATFGYPLTLQIGSYSGEASPPSIVVELREGSAKGAEVACHVSTPAKPSNPDLAIADAWCLIPKTPLKPATTYAATATWTDGRKIAWTFKTAK
jgi:hypothetical protein